MLHSLQLRLLLTMITVVVVTAGTVALLAQQITISEFQRFIQLSDARSERLGTLFGEASLLGERSSADRQAVVRQMASEMGDRVVLADPVGIVIADSDGSLIGRAVADAPAEVVLLQLSSDTAVMATQALPTKPLGMQLAITRSVGGMTMGQAIGPAPADQVFFSAAPLAISWNGIVGPDPIREGFISGVNRSISIALIVAGLVAFCLTAELSRRIIRPVEELTIAARKMATGDLSHRVQVGSFGEIAALGRAFNHMAEGLQRAEQLRSHMVNDVAHELRTPLTNIRGYLEALRDGVASPDARTINSLHEEALLLNGLIDDLQDVALAEAGQLWLQRTPTDLASVITHAVSVIGPRLQAKGVACYVEAPAELPCALIDAERIGQVLRNLLNNAMTHTPAGGSITVALSHADDLIVSVSDTGCGIAEQDLPLIFERFYRADRARARATGGAGLGLTIVRQLVEAHGGMVWATSCVGKGSQFMFSVPVAHS